MTTSPNYILHNLLELCPLFITTWEDEAELWADDQGEFTSCGVFVAFSHYIGNILASNASESLAAVFQFVERCMRESEDVSTAAATCFLENLMNRTPELIDPRRFVPLLGVESRAYCR